MPKFSVKKPLTILVAVLAILVLGVVAYLKMTPDLMPNMDFPYVVIVTSDPGASPESIEQEITKPLEASMATLDRIKSLTSSSQNSVSMVVLEFEDGVNMDTLSIDIQQKLTTLQGQWDDTVGAPYMLKINPSMLPAMVAAVSYEGKSVDEISDFVTKTLESKLTGVSGVASVDITGTVARQLHVLLDQEKLDDLSKELSGSIEKQIDEAEAKLKDAEKEALDGKEALKDGWVEFYKGKAEAEAKLKEGRSGLDQLNAMLDGGEKLLDSAPATLAGYQQLRAAPGLSSILPKASTPQELAHKLAEEPVKTALDTTVSTTRQQLAALPEGTPDAMKKPLQELVTGIEGMQAFSSGWLATEAGLKQVFAGKEDANVYTINDDTLLKLSRLITASEKEYAEGKAKAESGLKDGENQLRDGEEKLNDGLAKIRDGFAEIEKNRDAATGQIDLSKTLNINTISQLLTAQDFSMPAGYVSDKSGVSDMVSVGDKITSVEELRALVLFDSGLDDVDVITLGDVATVYEASNVGEIYAKCNGINGVIATFTKQSTYATAEVSNNLRARFASLENDYEGLSFSPLMDQGDYIYLIVETILSSLLWGALFGVAVLFLFLRNWRPTVVTLVSIPVSLVFAIVLMYFSGVTINMISLSGLAVSVGMLTDNSVVVIENIYRLRAKGVSAIRAAVTGTTQVAGAIASSTLTTVCVFLPIVFVEGLTRQMFTDLALTMTYALMASLIVAMTVVPAMGSTLLRRVYTPKKGLLDRLYPLYEKAAHCSLRHKAVVLLLALVLLVGSGYGAVARGFAFMPELDMNTVSVNVVMPEGCDRETAVSVADEVARRAMTVEHVETVGAMMSSGGTGGMSMGGLGGGTGGEYDVSMYITLPEGCSGIGAGRQIEALCSDMDCTVTSTGTMEMMTMLTGDGISVKIYGDDMEELQASAKKLAARLQSVAGTTDVSDGLDEAADAVHVTIDRALAMEHGMTVAQIYMQIVSGLTDSKAGSDMTLDDKSFSLLIETDEQTRTNRDSLLDMTITPDQGGDDFKLREVASVETTVSLNTISRDAQRRCLTVSAKIDDSHNVTLVTAEAQKALSALTLPEGVSIEWSGENEAIMDAMGQLLLMMALGVVLVYFVMVAQFQSLLSPFIVMFTIPLAFTGGFLALLIANVEVSVISLIGFVMLVGIVVNNGIVLVDYINQLRLDGLARRDAIVEAGVTRMRPILMTSLTTILGLIVMALAENAGTSLMRPVALVCIGGLLYATLMTLFVVPCMYDVFSRRELRKVDAEDLSWVES